jgi:hypothetical protein
MASVVSRAFGCVALALALASPRAARAQPDNLAAARSLFAEAVQDEDAGRFAVALLKFEKVRDVRDTAPVEYRIATCHEGLGEGPQAVAAYRAAVALGQDDPKSADVVRAASARIDALAPALPAPAPAPAPAAAPAPAPAPAPASAPAEPSRAWRTAGWIAAGGGAALAGAAAVLWVVRHEDIAALNRDCPRGACGPTVDVSDVESTRSRALVEGPVAVACGVAGLAALGVGAYGLLARTDDGPREASRTALAPMVVRGGAGIALAGGFP